MPSNKVLLVQLFSNGDCLYATAVARQLKQDIPHCHLTWAISPSCKNIIANNPFVDEIMEVKDVPKNDERAFRRFLKAVKNSPVWSQVVVTHIGGSNQANYDGCIRSTIFRGYRYPLTVNVQPVLRLTPAETINVQSFASLNRLASYKHVVLFEYAPLSGQSALSPTEALHIAEGLAGPEVAVILSSANKVAHVNAAIIDGSTLTIRETAGLTHFCSFLIGCSSGITWLTTSDAAKRLPMVQLLNPFTNWINAISRDFSRFHIDDSEVIELFSFTTTSVIDCVTLAVSDFPAAKQTFHEQLPLHFRTTRSIVYNLLCYAAFPAIARHIRINREAFGDKLSFYKEVVMGFLIFPFRLTMNLLTKKKA